MVKRLYRSKSEPRGILRPYDHVRIQSGNDWKWSAADMENVVVGKIVKITINTRMQTN